MVHSYVDKPNCIILAISPANQDIATSDAIKLSREVDPTGERTFGVLTKLDLMDKGTNALDVLEGKSYRLLHPWVGVVNRSQADINRNIDMIDARRSEREYFATSPDYSHLASKMGSEYLAKLLSKHLESVIRARIPTITSLINKTIDELESEMDDLGRPVAIDAGARLYTILELCRAFDRVFKEHLDGGYQEILTDPSYAGQFVLMTNPHIGNTGVNPDDEESSRCFLAGLVIRSLSICTSNWRCIESLDDYLAKRNIMAIYDVDTRAITRRLRQDGSLIGVLSTEESQTDETLLELARKWKITGVDLISGVSCKAPYDWQEKTDAEWEFNEESQIPEDFHVVAYDFGIKHNILKRLASYGCKITVVPSTWPASETLQMKPDGVMFSNGPGDPSAVPYAVETVKEIIGKVPIFGICMGHQLLGQALGGKTFKMKFGHHGGNHPVCDLRNGRVEISAQNHNYAVDPASLPAGVEVTHINLNDNSCAGLACPDLNILSLQYHPESSPGPHDSDSVFGEFVMLMKQYKLNTGA